MAAVRTMMEVAFNRGDLFMADDPLVPGNTAHQEPNGTSFATHPKEVITSLRAAFHDPQLELHPILAESNIVAFHWTTTGTYPGPFRNLAPAGWAFAVRHLHFLRMRDGRGEDLWHLVDTPSLMQQLTGPAPAQTVTS